jgi:crossover junction endodeoxyribonuclease RuvC
VKVVGLDLSLTSSGVASLWDGTLVAPYRVTRIQSKPGRGATTLEARAERLQTIVAEVLVWAADADLVVIEGPSFGQARQGGQHDRAGLWWLMVGQLTKCQVPTVEVPPACRAKYATGVGNASKDAVLAATVRRYPAIDVTGNDIADAVVLAAMGARHLGWPIDRMPATHLTAMAKVAWPTPAGDLMAVGATTPQRSTP